MVSIEVLLAVGEALGLVALVAGVVLLAGWAAGLVAGGPCMTVLCAAGARQARAIRTSRVGQRRA
jgi:hypothetical protein